MYRRDVNVLTKNYFRVNIKVLYVILTDYIIQKKNKTTKLRDNLKSVVVFAEWFCVREVLVERKVRNKN